MSDRRIKDKEKFDQGLLVDTKKTQLLGDIGKTRVLSKQLFC